MKISHVVPIAFAICMLALPSVSRAQLTWDFSGNTAASQGWTTLSGIEFVHGDGIGAAQAGGNWSHDGNHAVFVLESPEFTFTGNDTLTGGNAFRVGTYGGQGKQGGSTGDPANPAAVLGYNGGNSNNTGLKGVALLNTTTGNYDYIAYDPGNGGGNPDFGGSNSADFATTGVSLTDGYKVHIFDHDDGSWGWTRFRNVEVDATLGPPPAVPEPASVAIWALLGLAGFGYHRFRRKK